MNLLLRLEGTVPNLKYFRICGVVVCFFFLTAILVVFTFDTFLLQNLVHKIQFLFLFSLFNRYVFPSPSPLPSLYFL